jgi:cell division transport system ATP-binding protein
MRLLDRINRTGTTVVMATHDEEIVNQMRRRVIELDTGTLVRDQAHGAYGARGQVIPDPDRDTSVAADGATTGTVTGTVTGTGTAGTAPESAPTTAVPRAQPVAARPAAEEEPAEPPSRRSVRRHVEATAGE